LIEGSYYHRRVTGWHWRLSQMGTPRSDRVVIGVHPRPLTDSATAVGSSGLLDGKSPRCGASELDAMLFGHQFDLLVEALVL
jgi:hypothetical protein